MELNKSIKQAEKYLKDAPSDRLQLSPVKGTVQFYKTDADGKRHYVSKKNQREIKALAQKYYAERFLKVALESETKLAKFNDSFNPLACFEVYDNLNSELKQYITPYILSPEQYAEKWAEEEYETKGIRDGERFYTTEKGEKVRSKSELTIANKLYFNGIKYRYEEPHYLKGFGTVYPDFTVLNKITREEMLWEHFGLMDNPEYVRNCLKKLQTYADNNVFPGHGLIVTYESETVPLNTKTLDVIIQSFLLPSQNLSLL